MLINQTDSEPGVLCGDPGLGASCIYTALVGWAFSPAISIK